jgi:hypothetical protein
MDQNPTLAEYFRDKKPGDKCTLELRATVKGQDAEGVDLIVEAAVPEGYEVDETATGPELPASPMSGSVSSATMTPTAMMVRKKKTY